MLDQKNSYALGAISRQINFDTYNFAQNLLSGSFFDLFSLISSQNTTLGFEPESQLSSPALAGSTDPLKITLQMKVPSSQTIRVKLPIIESFKLAWLQYVSFLVLVYLIIYKLILGCAFRRKVFEASIVSEIHNANLNRFRVKQD